jgi:5-(hydroxymethyl)furfural/furfural oxidase
MIDYLILGGGSAGCVLAARLSENPSNTVVLVEAGRNVEAGRLPDIIASRYPGQAYLDTNNIWSDLKAFIGTPADVDAKRTVRRYEQARILGGGSAINAMMANRGAPDDYDEWGREGADGWSWRSVLPYFKKLERDIDVQDDFHGTNGPISIHRIKPEKMSPFARGIINTLTLDGEPMLSDQNGAWQDGIYIATRAVNEKGERVPASIAYLTPEARARPNLRVITDHLAERLIVDGTVTKGAEISRAQDPSQTQILLARETLVTCGAIHTPALLLRSGIGSAEQLKPLGISVVADLPGVGQNLMEHPSTSVGAYLPPHSRVKDLGEHHSHALLRFSSRLTGTPQGDMHAAMIVRSGWHSVGQRVGTMFVWVNKPYSRGFLNLKKAAAREEPLVDFRLLSDDRDLARLQIGFKVAAHTLLHPSMDPYRGPVFPASYSPRVAKLAQPGLMNALQRSLFGVMLDHSHALRPRLIKTFVTQGAEISDLLNDDSALASSLGSSVTGVWHASGTCKMGAMSDRMAVTDGFGRVHGVQGLRICDASLMPTIPRANTNIPVIMVAERLADLIKAA